MVWFGLVWSGLVWFGLVWSGLVWSGLEGTFADLLAQPPCHGQGHLLLEQVPQYLVQPHLGMDFTGCVGNTSQASVLDWNIQLLHSSIHPDREKRKHHPQSLGRMIRDLLSLNSSTMQDTTTKVKGVCT